MKRRLNLSILAIGILLLLASFAAYAIRINQTILPAGASPQEIEQFNQQLGLDDPLALQYRSFLILFLPAITLLGIYGTIGIRRPGDELHTWLTRVFLVLMLVTNAINTMIYVLSSATVEPFSAVFWVNLVVAGLGLVNYLCTLVIWNRFKWGMWGFAVATFIVFTINFLAGLSLLTNIFNLSAPILLYILIRPVWHDMD